MEFVTDADMSPAAALARSAAGTPGFGVDVGTTLEWVADVGSRMPLPGAGATAELWAALATAASLDVGAARMLEPHLDALAILAQSRDAGIDTDAVHTQLNVEQNSTWGVFAAEGPGTRLEARRDGDDWLLHGIKPWCSLAADVSHALVTAWTGPDTRRLFAVSLRGPGVTAHTGPWTSRGLAQVVSAPVDFAGAAAVPVGGDGWYLRRAGFAWGGIGVAAVWWGAALPLRDALVGAASRDGADQLAAMFAGDADAAAWASRTVLDAAATAVDAGVAGDDASLLAARVRAVVSDAAEKILSLADRALGPGPLTSDEEHARRVADLRVYLRQHHGERDLARLGVKVAR